MIENIETKADYKSSNIVKVQLKGNKLKNYKSNISYNWSYKLIHSLMVKKE